MPVLLITGSNRGTGYAVAQHYYNNGYQIISLNRTLVNEPWLGEIKCDLNDVHQVVAACKNIANEVSSIEVCFLNAAVRKLSFIGEMSIDDWQQSVNINYSSVFYTLKTLLPLFKQSKTFVVVMGSHAGSYFFDGGAAYCSTKAALKGLTEVFIQETRDFGIRTTLINAGAINNRPKGNDDKKIQVTSLAKLIFTLTQSEADIIPAEIEIRPAIPLSPHENGIAKIQYV